MHAPVRGSGNWSDLWAGAVRKSSTEALGQAKIGGNPNACHAALQRDSDGNAVYEARDKDDAVIHRNYVKKN